MMYRKYKINDSGREYQSNGDYIVPNGSPCIPATVHYWAAHQKNTLKTNNTWRFKFIKKSFRNTIPYHVTGQHSGEIAVMAISIQARTVFIGRPQKIQLTFVYAKNTWHN